MKKALVILGVIVVAWIVLYEFSGGGKAPDGREELYDVATEYVQDNLTSPTSAIFPDYDSSYVTYNSSTLADMGEGVKLEYRIYDVKAYVDSMNAYGAMIREEFHVQVYAYVDDYNSPQYGEAGIHKGIEDHYYIMFK